MASAWQQGANSVVEKLNNKFKDKPTVVAAAQDFQTKHGPKGKGEGGKKPYKFGNFAGFDNTVIVNPQDQAKWLIDTGTRNWDSSLALMEETIRANLSDTGPQVPMKFTIFADGGNKARVVVNEKKDGSGVLINYEIEIHCRT